MCPLPDTPETMILYSRSRLVDCMKRAGSGQRISVRALASAAGCHPSKIAALRSGARKKSTYAEAKAIADYLGVDVLFLWDHASRTAAEQRLTTVPA